METKLLENTTQLYTKELQVCLYDMMVSRESDIRENILYRQGRGQFHLPSAGHEAISILSRIIQKEDWLYCYYRDKALILSRGVSLKQIALDFYSKAESSSGGRQMSSHFSAPEFNIVSCASPTALQCLPACGSAWYMKQNGLSSIVYCFIGDAATREGEFLESVAFAMEKQLPIIFVIEDNGYGISTKTKESTPLSLGMMPNDNTILVDGTDPEDILHAANKARNALNKSHKPAFLWLKLDRIMSHTSSDNQSIYRTQEELSNLIYKDPIELLKNRLCEQAIISEDWYLESLVEIKEYVKQVYQSAEKNADPVCYESNVFSDSSMSTDSYLDITGIYSIADSVRYTLQYLLTNHPKTLLFGQDIEDPKGGVFGLTKGLSTQYPARVFNAPLAEATIAGVASGVSINGGFPIFELQFIDFIGTAFNQIVNQIATLRWRTNGNTKCPLIIYAPCGGYVGGGAWHSQTNESLLAHATGLKVYMPSNAQDASDMFISSANGNDPVIILLPKNLLHKNISYSSNTAFLENANKLIDGKDVTIVSWGNTIHLSLCASKILSDKHNISVEIIDIRSIVPLDINTIKKSVMKTGCLIVVQEDNYSCSLGQSIIQNIVSDLEIFQYLKSPPQLIARKDTPISFNKKLESLTLPQINDIVSVITNINGEEQHGN